MAARYVFVVGLPRTGTKLVKHVLESARAVHCRLSPETFYVGQLFRRGMRHRIAAVGDARDDAVVDRITELMFSGELHGYYWERLANGSLGVDRDAMRTALLQSDRTERGIYEALLSVHVEPHSDVSAVLGDKTPSHIYHVPKILEWFPDAKIVHTFRDLRAVLASEWRRRMDDRPDTLRASCARPFVSPMIVLHMTYAWLKALRLHREYVRRFPDNYYLCKFEDLVSDPATFTPRLCEFLGVEMCDAMLAPRQSGSSFAQRQTSGFDRNTLVRWKTQLKPWMRRWLELVAGKELREFGYTDEGYRSVSGPERVRS